MNLHAQIGIKNLNIFKILCVNVILGFGKDCIKLTAAVLV